MGYPAGQGSRTAPDIVPFSCDTPRTLVVHLMNRIAPRELEKTKGTRMTEDYVCSNSGGATARGKSVEGGFFVSDSLMSD